MKTRNLKKYILSGVMSMAIMFTSCKMPVFANNDVYEGVYNIHAAIAYADEYTDYEGDYNSLYGYYKENGDCTNFVSQCISVGGGLQQEGNFKPNVSRWGNYHPWTVAPDLYEHLTETKGYDSGNFSGGYIVDQKSNAISVWTDGGTSISVGDVVFFDFGSNGSIDHAAIIVGYDSAGHPCYAGHTNNRWMWPLGNSATDQGYDINIATTYYIVHMTDTAGLTDVTSRYIGKTVAIKSLETGQYVSCNADQNVDNVNVGACSTYASTWEYFDVIENKYGEVGFKSHENGNYLSTRVDVDAAAAPVRVAYGQNYSAPQAMESFRIFEKDGVQYIQSQANGKWVQISADIMSHPMKACGKAASTWEQFSIEIIDSLLTDIQMPVLDSISTDIRDNYVSADTSSSIVSQAYGSGYNEGLYTGEWSNGLPDGWGKLEYIDYNGDGKYYTFLYGGESYKALYYEGNFSEGCRYGTGTVIYEGGWKEEGTFYGVWEAGKKVFEGRVWYKDGSYYLDGYLTATSSTEGEWTWYTDTWQPVE